MFPDAHLHKLFSRTLFWLSALSHPSWISASSASQTQLRVIPEDAAWLADRFADRSPEFSALMRREAAGAPGSLQARSVREHVHQEPLLGSRTTSDGRLKIDVTEPPVSGVSKDPAQVMVDASATAAAAPPVYTGPPPQTDDEIAQMQRHMKKLKEDNVHLYNMLNGLQGQVANIKDLTKFSEMKKRKDQEEAENEERTKKEKQELLKITPDEAMGLVRDNKRMKTEAIALEKENDALKDNIMALLKGTIYSKEEAIAVTGERQLAPCDSCPYVEPEDSDF